MTDFSDLRIVDLGWIWAGPLVSSAFADLGADVIKVESSARLDPYRLRGVERDPRYDASNRHEASPSFHKLNRGKRSVTVNLGNEAGRELAARLCEQADLVLENFSAGTLEKLGLGWDRLHDRNPRTVVMSMSGGGQHGRWRDLRAYALVTTALGGYESLVAYPGEEPIGAATFGIADPAVSSFAVVAAGAALWRARRTGEGCYLDVSGIESTIMLLGAALLTDRSNSPAAATLTLPAKEEDSWIVAVVASQRDLDILTGLAGIPDADQWPDLAVDQSAIAGLADQLSQWSQDLSSAEAVETIRGAGVAAAPVWSIEDRDKSELVRLPTLHIDHPVTGAETMLASPWGTTGTPSPAPALGQHTERVLAEWLGLSSEEIESYRNAGALT